MNWGHVSLAAEEIRQTRWVLQGVARARLDVLLISAGSSVMKYWAIGFSTDVVTYETDDGSAVVVGGDFWCSVKRLARPS